MISARPGPYIVSSLTAPTKDFWSVSGMWRVSKRMETADVGNAEHESAAADLDDVAIVEGPASDLIGANIIGTMLWPSSHP